MTTTLLLNDKTLFAWMKGDKSAISGNTLSDWLYELPNSSGINPNCHTFNFPCHSPQNNMEKIVERMSNSIPPWYWQRLRFAAFHYHSFWNSLWPKVAEITNELFFLEWLLHVEPGYQGYRDHLLHMFKVAFIGMQLLEQKEIISKIAPSFFKDHTKKWAQENLKDLDLIELVSSCTSHYKPFSIVNKTKQIIYWSFLLAALLHDLGYAYSFRKYYDSYTNRLTGWLANRSTNCEPSILAQNLFKKSLVGELFRSKACNNNKNEAKEASERRLSGILRDNIFLNHSFASALFILSLENSLKESGSINDEMRLAFQLAAEGVLFHDITNTEKNSCGLNYNIFAKIHSTGKLLVLCDELAVWGRPRLKTKVKASMPNCLNISLGNVKENNDYVKLTLDKSVLEYYISNTITRDDVKDKIKDLYKCKIFPFCGLEIKDVMVK